MKGLPSLTAGHLNVVGELQLGACIRFMTSLKATLGSLSCLLWILAATSKKKIASRCSESRSSLDIDLGQ